MEKPSNHNHDPEGQLEKSKSEEAKKMDLILRLPTVERFRLDEFFKEVKGLSSPEDFINSPEVQKIAKDNFIKLFEYDSAYSYAPKYKKYFNLSEEFLQSKEVQDGLIKEFETLLSGRGWTGYGEPIHKALELKEDFSISNERIILSLKKRLISLLASGDINQFVYLKKKFDVTEDVAHAPEVREVIEDGIVNCIMDYWQNTKSFILDIQEEFSLSDEFVDECVKAGFIKLLTINKISSISSIKKNFSISDDFIKSEEVKEAAGVTFILEIERGHVESAAEIKNNFDLSDEILSSQEFKSAFRKYYFYSTEGFVSNLMKVKEILKNIPDEIIKQLAVEKITELISGKYVQVDKVLEIKKDLGIPDEALQWLAPRRIVNLIKDGSTITAFELKDGLNIPNELLYQGLDQDLKARIDFIKGISKVDVFGKIELFTFIITMSEESFETIKQNPFLFETLENNPSMGFKLLSKYPSLDQISHDAIKEIFDIKERVLVENQGVDPESSAFRILVQNELIHFKKNKEIIESMKSIGIDVDVWLNYSEEDVFELGGSESSFADMVKAPSERIEVVLKEYQTSILSVLSKYKAELQSSKIDKIDTEDLKLKLKDAEVLLQKTQSDSPLNSKKIIGIQKSMEVLQRQIDNPSKVEAWIKIKGDIDLIKKAFEKSLQLNEEIISLDDEMKHAVKEENKKRAFIMKKEISSKVVSFKNALDISANRLEGILDSIKTSVSKALGSEIATASIEEISSRVLEHKEHFLSDKRALEELLSDEGDEDKKGSLVKIKIWDRNADIDLYMGNYTECCVRIDSEYHEDGSPIADYVTDLGMQIIAIYDEETQKPFAAAWCWPSTEFGPLKVFVVDNIEAYGPNLKYKDQLEKRLQDYIYTYSKACGFDKVVQGEDNNDMWVASVGKGDYRKIGPTNRPDGYYLEAAEEDYEDEEDQEDDFYDETEEETEVRMMNEYSDSQEITAFNSLEEAFRRVGI